MRALRWLLVVLVVLGVLLVVADRVGVWGAQQVVADQVERELASYQVDTAPPEVRIEGTPFLTQVAGGRYEQVTLLLREVRSAGFELSHVDLVATGVTASVGTLVSGEGAIDAERVEGTAQVGYGAVAGLTGVEGLELSAGEGGALAVRSPAELLGEPVTLVGTADVTVTPDGVVRLQVDELAVAEQSQLPAGAEAVVEEVVADVAQQLSADVPLPPLPYGLTVDSVRAEPAGIVVQVSATDVPLAR